MRLIQSRNLEKDITDGMSVEKRSVRRSREWSDGRIATPVASQYSAAWPPALGVLVHLHERQVQQGTEHRGRPPLHTHTYTHTQSQGCKHES